MKLKTRKTQYAWLRSLLVSATCLALIFMIGCDSSTHDGVGKNAKADAQSNETDNQDAEPVEPVAPLISAVQLQKLIESKDDHVKILEPGRMLSEFSEGHLPTAQFLHWVDDMTDLENTDRYNNPQPEQFAQLMSKLGISNDDHIVIYDRMNCRLSTRLFWTFKCFGHDRIQILNGGFDSWKAQSFEVSQKTREVAKSSYKISSVREELFAEMDYIKTQLENPSTRLVDGRPPAQFSGAEPGKVFHTHQPHPRNGHIPSATNVFWHDNFQEDGTFKSNDELNRMYSEAGIQSENSVITYCNEGLHAAPAWFVLTQLLEYENVRLYDSSMAEWTKTDNPMATTAPEN